MTPRLAFLIALALLVLTLVSVVTQAPTHERDEPVRVHSVGWDHPVDEQTIELAPVVTLPPTRAHETGPTTAGALLIASTGYCETGAMADGQPAHDGAVSSHVLARGSRWRVLDGRYAGNVYTVEDTGPLATFDIAMPGRCDEAIAYGRHMIHIEAA